MTIDWSKAPEGATHYDTRPGCMRNFMRLHSESCDEWQYWTGVRWNYYGAIGDAELMEERPTAWNGEGLPPVGTVCELRHETWGDERFERRTILFIGETYAITTDDSGEELATQRRLVEFRPIRTPEQIAAEERAKAIDEMWSVYWQPDVPTAKQALGLLYDAGYRKQVAP